MGKLQSQVESRGLDDGPFRPGPAANWVFGGDRCSSLATRIDQLSPLLMVMSAVNS